MRIPGLTEAYRRLGGQGFDIAVNSSDDADSGRRADDACALRLTAARPDRPAARDDPGPRPVIADTQPRSYLRQRQALSVEPRRLLSSRGR